MDPLTLVALATHLPLSHGDVNTHVSLPPDAFWNGCPLGWVGALNWAVNVPFKPPAGAGAERLGSASSPPLRTSRIVATAATIITMATGTTIAVRRYHGHGAESSGSLPGGNTSDGAAGWACVGAAALSACADGAPRCVSAQALSTCSGVPAW